MSDLIRVQFFPESSTRLVSKTVDVTMEFVKNARIVVTGLNWNQLGSERARKIY
jgi:hypothetical protein